MQQGFKKHMSTAATQYTQSIFKTTATQYTHPTFKTTATQYTLPTSLNHSYTWTKSQHLPLNTTAVPYQSITHHTLKHTYSPAPSTKHHSPKHSLPLPSSLPTPQATTHLPYDIPSRPTHKANTGITYQTSSTLAPQSPHTHHQHKPTHMRHAKKNNQMTKTTITNSPTPHTYITFPQHTSQAQPNFLQTTTKTQPN